jgi:hypothetical protein
MVIAYRDKKVVGVFVRFFRALKLHHAVTASAFVVSVIGNS